MARARLYANNAEKQAAYRARHTDRQAVPQRRLASLVQELHGRLRQAGEAGTNRLPAAVLGPRADETLINLIRYVTRGLPEEEAAPRRPGGEGDAARATAPPAPRPPRPV